MRNATELLAQYAEYHRDRRNIVSHFVGVPMIVFGVGVLLARAAFAAFGVSLTLAWIVFALAAAWYLTRGSLVLGIAVSLAVGVLIKLGQKVAGGSVAVWLAWGVGLLLRRLGDPVHRPLVRGQEAGVRRRRRSASSSGRCSSPPR